MTRIVSALAIALLATGCHGKFKKHVGGIDDVRPDMTMPGGPYVALGMAQGDDLVSGIVNVAQGVKSIDLTKRVSAAVEPGEVADAFVDELDVALGDGPPFAADPSSATILQIEMRGYGIDVAGLGMPGALTYNLNTRIYLPDGERVYTANHKCAVPFGDPKAVSVVLGTVNNSRAVKDMSDEELRDMFAAGARWCAQQTVLRIRRHAG